VIPHDLASALEAWGRFSGRAGRPPLCSALVAVVALAAPACAESQAAPRALTPAESEAFEMGFELAFACSPRRHNQAAGSESTIRRERDVLAGTAVHFRSVDGAFLVLEEYDAALAGHCLVIGWFGGGLEPGRHGIDRLAMRTVEDEVDAGRHSFYAMSAVRTADENSVFVVESGTLDLRTVEGDRIEGTFELSGFLADANGASRVSDAAWAGSFRALRGEP
jgi:hypothetical protein